MNPAERFRCRPIGFRTHDPFGPPGTCRSWYAHGRAGRKGVVRRSGSCGGFPDSKIGIGDLGFEIGNSGLSCGIAALGCTSVGYVSRHEKPTRSRSGAVSSEIVFIETYSCPHCRAELETGFNDWQGWQRCPACGLACLPAGANRSAV